VAGNVSAGLRQAFHQTGADDVRARCQHDWNGLCRARRAEGRRIAGRDDHLDAFANQFFRQFLKFRRLPSGPTVGHLKILAFGPAEFL
jgi:hypothetical protein